MGDRYHFARLFKLVKPKPAREIANVAGISALLLLSHTLFFYGCTELLRGTQWVQ